MLRLEYTMCFRSVCRQKGMLFSIHYDASVVYFPLDSLNFFVSSPIMSCVKTHSVFEPLRCAKVSLNFIVEIMIILLHMF